MDIVAALHANGERFRAYGKIMGAKFSDEDEADYTLSKAEAEDAIKAVFGGKRGKGDG